MTKKVKFYFRGRCLGSEVEEIVEFEDDVTEEEIEEDFEMWLYEQSQAGWKEL